MSKFILIQLLYFITIFKIYPQTPQLQLTEFISDLYRPTDIESTTDGRLFVSQMDGKIYIIENGIKNPVPFLDISNKIKGAEFQGIFGFAFHPNYASNGYIYVHYLIPSNEYSRYSRFTRNSQYPNIIDSNSEQIIYEVPYANNGHRSGDFAFGPDGYLYITTGDGAPGARGSIGDPEAKAQNLQSVYGKILRIDVNNGSPYSIPPSNPYLTPNDGIPDEIWASGLRNPWKWSFDKLSGDIWIGDNGQDGWDEVDHLPANVTGVKNFGWPCFEGSHAYLSSKCQSFGNLIMPTIEYAGYNNNNQTGASVLGGYVYRGQQYPNLKGWYVYADYTLGKFWIFKKGSSQNQARQLATDQNILQNISLTNPITFGQDYNGELYVANFLGGKIYKISDANNTALPLAFLSLSVELTKENMAQINWITTDEQNIEYFEIEASIDAQKFESLGKVQSTNDNEAKMHAYNFNYNLLKMNKVKDIIYFRIKYKEFNNEHKYSKIIVLNLESKKQPIIKYYPNPVVDGQLAVEVFAENYTNCTMRILNTLGVELIKTHKYLHEGLNSLTLNIDSLVKGIYFLEINIGQQKSYHKLLKN